jgi:hypothetical protein
VSEEMRCVLLCMLEVVQVPEELGGAGGETLCATGIGHAEDVEVWSSRALEVRCSRVDVEA